MIGPRRSGHGWAPGTLSPSHLSPRSAGPWRRPGGRWRGKSWRTGRPCETHRPSVPSWSCEEIFLPLPASHPPLSAGKHKKFCFFPSNRRLGGRFCVVVLGGDSLGSGCLPAPASSSWAALPAPRTLGRWGTPSLGRTRSSPPSPRGAGLLPPLAPPRDGPAGQNPVTVTSEAAVKVCRQEDKKS